MTVGGVSCTSTTNNNMGAGVILLNLDNTIDADGTLTSWCCKANIDDNVRLRVFRDDGTNFVYVGGTGAIAVTSGWNTGLPCNIAVLAGDIIGVHHDNSQPTTTGGGGHGAYRGGDTTTTLPQTDWITLDNDNIAAVGASGTALLTNVYVSTSGNDSYAGDSCVAGHPKLTFAAAYAALASGGTIHCCDDSDFSTETVTLNKSFSIDHNGSTGYFYMPQAN